MSSCHDITSSDAYPLSTQDDDLAVEFVTAASALRSFNYDIPSQSVSHAFLEDVSVQRAFFPPGPLKGALQVIYFLMMRRLVLVLTSNQTEAIADLVGG
jgi:hypothetical protein